MASVYVKPISGSAGRIKVSVLKPDADDPVPAGAVVYAASGTWGANARAATATIGLIRKFDLTFQTEDGGAFVHYESEMTATYMLWKEQVQGGTIQWVAQIDAIYNRDPAVVADGTYNPAGTNESVSRFLVGAFVVVDFVLDKPITGSGYGSYGNVGKVHGPKISTDVNGNVVGFTCEVRGHGPLASFSIPS